MGNSVTDYMLYKAIALLILAFVWNFIIGFTETSRPPAPRDKQPGQEGRELP